MSQKCTGSKETNAACSCSPDKSQAVFPIFPGPEKETACGGAPSGPQPNAFDRPGYQLGNYVEGFEDTVVGPIPQIKTILDAKDRLGTVMTRIGIGRDNYSVVPGLYCIGKPNHDSPVMVTANYKLSFDHLRQELSGLNIWIVVIDTCGINVWCAAGEGTFSTDEVVNRINMIGLEKVVKHREIILPQLAAPGVSARQVKKQSGFRVIWGPVRAGDIQAFLKLGKKADSSMRRVTFSLRERFILIPVELSLVIKPAMIIFLAILLLSGIGPNFFSFNQAFSKGTMAIAAIIAGIFAGAVVAPIFLPWIPGKAFSFKGSITGLLFGLVVVIIFWGRSGLDSLLALMLITIAMSSYLAMNFTGATPFTSPSGVEKEMRVAIPIQAGAVVVSLFLWIGSAFN